MGIDSTTVLKYFSGSILVIVLLFLFYLYSSKNKHWFTISYLIGKILQLLAVIGVIFRDVLPDIITVNISAILLIASYCFEIFSIISYDGKYRPKVLFFLVAFFFISSITFSIFSHHEAYRSAISSLTAAIIFGVGAIDLFKFRQKLKFPILISIVILLFCLVQLFRGIIILFQLNTYEVAANTPTDTLFYVTAFVYLTMSSVGFLLLMKEHDELQLSIKNKILEETTISKNKLFSIIAHDLKSPIAAMASIGQVLLDQHNELTPEQREEIINDITNSSQETYNLLNNLLLWTQSETGQLEAKFEKTDINSLVSENIRLLKKPLENKQLNTKVKLIDNAFAFADKNMINTSIRNILSNAIKFTPSGGLINIETEQNNGIISLSISDNGFGIDYKTLRNIFDLNPEHNKRGTNQETGTGLGLKLCKEFIDKNNGSISVESNLGSGSTFTIQLPKFST